MSASWLCLTRDSPGDRSQSHGNAHAQQQSSLYLHGGTSTDLQFRDRVFRRRVLGAGPHQEQLPQLTQPLWKLAERPRLVTELASMRRKGGTEHDDLAMEVGGFEWLDKAKKRLLACTRR